ncbi:MAG: hypothetical protein COA45_06570 [Zetaproteobacteria bacterium]|nr:MAG: hypothetical protein COA45_06570 [Zetaproteobacteria bacterium]
MLEFGKSSYNCLIEAFHRAEKIANNPEAVLEFKEALESNAFKRRNIKAEGIYTQSGILAYELLARPNNGTRSFSIGNLSKISHGLDIAKEFDALTCSNALKIAKEIPLPTPITLNISVDAALSEEFWAYMRVKLEQFEPEDIIFEILENDVNRNADITHLKEMRALGYRFALDDLSIGADHENRLHAFGDLVNFIKIDGPFVRAGLGDENTEFTQGQFNETIKHLQSEYPDCTLIAERVHNREEAQYLFDIGFSGVQGWDLKPEDFIAKPHAEEILLIN